MDSVQLKSDFKKQLEDVDARIKKTEEDLEQLKEYKFKLQGGLETLELLESTEKKA
jgi:hypothetical protein